ncbi:hypothetical protein DE146DRAFT_634305 [Phaeosphaeria sp. MPI-PUGE-AT-0046c]|nr:hypothetical protein DE146DRAFT_634305 [Phaeosphaeria sp. MPI-PUGE-AT-0046c]
MGMAKHLTSARESQLIGGVIYMPDGRTQKGLAAARFVTDAEPQGDDDWKAGQEFSMDAHSTRCNLRCYGRTAQHYSVPALAYVGKAKIYIAALQCGSARSYKHRSREQVHVFLGSSAIRGLFAMVWCSVTVETWWGPCFETSFARSPQGCASVAKLRLQLAPRYQAQISATSEKAAGRSRKPAKVDVSGGGELCTHNVVL